MIVKCDKCKKEFTFIVSYIRGIKEMKVKCPHCDEMTTIKLERRKK